MIVGGGGMYGATFVGSAVGAGAVGVRVVVRVTISGVSGGTCSMTTGCVAVRVILDSVVVMGARVQFPLTQTHFWPAGGVRSLTVGHSVGAGRGMSGYSGGSVGAIFVGVGEMGSRVISGLVVVVVIRANGFTSVVIFVDSLEVIGATYEDVVGASLDVVRADVPFLVNVACSMTTHHPLCRQTWLRAQRRPRHRFL
jgi:hypothetical protein